MTGPSRFFSPDLSQLAPADLIEVIDYETILTDQKAWVLATWDAFRAGRSDIPALDTLTLETEPITILLEVFAYRETLMRALVNDKARAVLLAYSTGTDLDHLGALFSTARRQIGVDASGNPIMQSDEEYRQEIELAPEGFSVAGPEGAYIYFARRSHPSIIDAAALHPGSNRIDIVLLARDGSGTASSEAISAAYDALSPKTTRPLTDDVRVQSASIVSTAINVTLRIRQGPAPETLRAAALAAIDKYRAARRLIGVALRVDGIIAAARSAGDIEQSIVVTPTQDVDPGAYGAVHVTGITVNVEVLAP